MNSLPLEEIAAMCGGRLDGRQAGITVRRISKDTRTLVPGDLYFALRGGNFDGNAFLEAAAAKGAAAAVIDDPAAPPPEGFPVIIVQDGLVALQTLASAWRDRLALKVVCITGSNGKTSTKEFTSAVLSVRYRTVKTEGNLNNHIGVPLSILAAEVADGAAVWELGMNHSGEIAPLAALARPDVGIVTNIGVAHIEHLGSREGIAREKRELLAALGPEGTAIFPADDDFVSMLAQVCRSRIFMTGGTDGELRAEDVSIGADSTSFTMVRMGSRVPAKIPVPGKHMVSNALLAAAAGLACGLSLEECAEGLEQTTMAGGRLTRRNIRGVTFLDDTYNANPDSMTAALGVLSSLPVNGRRIAVLGRMGELGEHALEGYRKVGTAGGADVLIAVGPETRPMVEAANGRFPEIHSVETTSEAADLLRKIAAPGDLVLVKGSRAARMENIINSF